VHDSLCGRYSDFSLTTQSIAATVFWNIRTVYEPLECCAELRQKCRDFGYFPAISAQKGFQRERLISLRTRKTAETTSGSKMARRGIQVKLAGQACSLV
jgi:hypothetical protein